MRGYFIHDGLFALCFSPLIFLGKVEATKSDEVPKREGGGSFSIQKIILQILDFYKGLFSDVL